MITFSALGQIVVSMERCWVLKVISRMRCLVLATTAAMTFPACSLVFDAVDLSNRRTKAIAEGEIVAGDGFTVRSPEAGLYPSLQSTQQGGVTLRPTEPFLDGLVYLVTPFEGNGATTPQEAFERWNDIPKARGFTVVAFESDSTNFRGLPAYRSSVELSKGSIRQVGSLLIVQRSSDFLVLSTGHPHFHPQTREERIKFTSERLIKLQSATELNRR